jgi:acyl-[acyl-carrier-protein]-phospholipid O-acyltransferase/long-chain-fatty-acid--[acyl-carrier-protein] ligase
MASATAASTSATRDGLSSKGFTGLVATQFLGAWNDNMFRWLAVPIAQPILGNDEALAIGLASFTVPYLLLATGAGYLADRFSKRSVIVGCKVAEIVLMLLGVASILFGSLWMLFGVVALMGCQSALFGPAKFGSLPEILKPDKLSAGNGWMGLVTVAASALGTISGLWLYSVVTPDLNSPPGLTALLPVAAVLLSVAVVGWLCSLLIPRVPAADPERKPAVNPVTDTVRNLKLLVSNKPLLRTALGIGFFWMLASLAQMNIDPFGEVVLGLDKSEIGLLMGVLVVGLGLGSVLAGLASGKAVELGLVPLGAMGIATCSLFLFLAGSSVIPDVAIATQNAYAWTCFWLFALGVFSGLFNIPLEAYLQHNSESKTRGTILAASNFVAFSFILVASGLFWLMRKQWGLSPSEVFLVAGLGTVPVVVYAFGLLPQATIRFVVWLASRTVYRVRVFGREHLPEEGGALLVANHVSWLDGVLLLTTSSRPIRMLAYADYVESRWLRWVSKLYDVIPIKAEGGPKAIMRSLQTAREAVANGELVCIFAEGTITRTGQLQPFQKGLLRIVKGTDAPVVPVYLDELWGSIFSHSGGKFLWKRPKQWPYPVSISFGPSLENPDDVDQVRQAVQTLGVASGERRKGRSMVPPRQFLRKCRQALFRPKVADSGGQELTGGRLLAGTLIFKRLLEREVFAPDEKMIGVLLPPSVGGVLANTAVSLSKRVAVNLNYTLSEEDLGYCVRECGIRHVLTSRRFLEKKPFNLDVEFIYLEDLKEKITGVDKLLGMLQAFLLPAIITERIHGLTTIDPDDLLTVIFTSGSTGNPKGVMLSHHNIASNITAVDQLFHITPSDVLLGILPFFHSFGYTGTLWLTMTLDPKTVYHFNPLDSRQVGKLSEKHGTTIIMATPTFLRSYLKRCTPEQMHKLDLVIVGAEKMPADLSNAFKEKFGVEPTEGYGTTELSPVAAFNVPPHRAGIHEQVTEKFGTVGRVMPGAAAKVVDPDTQAELGTDTEGLLLIQGPNVMCGYLNQPEKTAEVIRDGWYDTGDIAKIDSDGFIEITGRQSRFSKIGGEMVPHIKIEEHLNRIIEVDGDEDDDDDAPDVKLAVTSVPDTKKGERIIVLHKPLGRSVDDILKELGECGLPNLWLPSRDSFIEVDAIPLLGTGKLDLKGVQQTALEKTGLANAG